MAETNAAEAEAERIRKITPDRFRILVCGRANAGKTTILRRLCGAAEDDIPIVNWKEGGIDALDPTELRGEHNINDEITFKSNAGYVFHDSRGIECGGVDEVDTLKSFIEERAYTENFKERLHVIWLCVSADSDRPFLEGGAEMKILESKTGQVPIIVVLSKCEALEAMVFPTLTAGGLTEDEALEQAPEEARLVLKREFHGRLEKAGHPFDQTVELRRMNEPDANCGELVSATEKALKDDNIAKLFLVTERANIDRTAATAIRRAIRSNSVGQDHWVQGVAEWFPHNWRTVELFYHPNSRKHG